mgnify:CR=1 FL=1
MLRSEGPFVTSAQHLWGEEGWEGRVKVMGALSKGLSLADVPYPHPVHCPWKCSGERAESLWNPAEQSWLPCWEQLFSILARSRQGARSSPASAAERGGALLASWQGHGAEEAARSECKQPSGLSGEMGPGCECGEEGWWG